MRLAWPLLASGVLLLFTPGSSCAATDPPLVIRGVRIFDGHQVIERASVVVRDGKIEAVGPSVAVPANAAVVDGQGRTLLPGLIDAHTHVWQADQLKAATVFGVTTELDLMGDAGTARRLKAEASASRDLADLRAATNAVTAPKGHGTEYGFAAAVIHGPNEAEAFVSARIREGADYIKIVYDDGRAYGLYTPTIDKATLSTAIAAAHSHHKLAIVHIGTFENAREAIAAGADGLAHLFVDRLPDAGFAPLVADHRAFVIPTLSVLHSACGEPAGTALVDDAALRPYLNDADVGNLKARFPKHRDLSCAIAAETVRRLKAAHVPILAGTDAPNPGTIHGATLHGELALLVQAGLSPTEALAGATSLPAERFGLTDRGRIAAGLRADLVLVDGDPTRDIQATRKIVGVWRAGHAIDRSAYRVSAELREKAQAAVRERGLVSDFEAGKVESRFGAGWTVSTDQMRGGHSEAEIQVVKDGARGSGGSLSIFGRVAEGAFRPWAGATFAPGELPMVPTDLSSKTEIRFWAKGDGRRYIVLLFSAGRGPAKQEFIAGPAWQQVVLPLRSFDGLDGHDLTGLFVGAGGPTGQFEFQIDEVEFR
jgi:imidazolonepropionase-like amidohydrolase